MLPPAVMWVDPGKMTGVARYMTQPAAPHLARPGMYPEFDADEFPFHEACSMIEAMCGMYGRGLAIGWERFDINDQTHKKTREGIHDALHVIGVCRFTAPKFGCRVLEPGQQHTPDKAEQAQLKALGWWVPGKDDAQSAACHMLRYLVRTNELTPAQRELLYSK